MKILVIGSGGREHAICWALNKSKKTTKLYCAPGNGGISKIAKCININAIDIDGVIKFSKKNKIDLVFVAPDNPLSLGMVDELEKNNIKAFGPTKSAAIIESSKVYSKWLMKKYNIPTANYDVFDCEKRAIAYLDNIDFPVVIKADGLALGKGVIIAKTKNEAIIAITEMLKNKKFGLAGKTIIIEEFLEGPEISILAFTDGKTIKPMVSSQDYKAVGEGNMGLNTGGMGSFSPSPLYTQDIANICMEKVFKPTLDALNNENKKFKGVLYFGLMLTKNGIKVLEYNARFGDPETQVVLTKLKTDLVSIIESIINERLDEINIEWENVYTVCVIAASGGYPLQYKKGYIINGLEDIKLPSIVFHAGTKIDMNGKFFTNGGRVLGLTSFSKDSLEKARKISYEALKNIKFDNIYIRKDIAKF